MKPMHLERESFEPLWHQLKEQIRSQILSQQEGFKPGERLCPEQELAATLEINHLTIRKAYDALAKEGLIVRRRRKGTFICEPKASSKRQNLMIGVLAGIDWWLAGEFVTYQLAGLRKQARIEDERISTILSSVEHEVDLGAFCEELGALVVIGDGIQKETLIELQKYGLPMVVTLTDRTSIGITSVVFDEEEDAYQQTRYLIDKGHRRIGMIYTIPSLIRQQRRIYGYKRALREAGIDFNSELVVRKEMSFINGQQAAEELLSLQQPPTAIVTSSVNFTAGVMIAAEQRGIHIPDNLSVIGNGDLENAEVNSDFSLMPTMSVESFKEMGKAAFLQICQEISCPNRKSTLIKLAGHIYDGDTVAQL